MNVQNFAHALERFASVFRGVCEKVLKGTKKRIERDTRNKINE